MNTHIKTGLSVIIIIIIAITTGVFVWKYYEINPISDATIAPIKKPTTQDKVQMANPASVFCKYNGGTLEIRTGEDGGQIGMCKFSDGSECEEWKFMRGECKMGDSQNNTTTDNSDWQTYRNDKFGFEIKSPKDWIIKQNENSLSFNTPETQKDIDELVKKHIGTEAPSDMYITYHKDLADLLSGIFPNDFNSLQDYINNKFTYIEPIDFANEKAWFVNNDEDMIISYSIIVEHNKKIYRIDLFKDWLYGETNDYASLSQIGKEILSTFKFTN